jgi:hypothetical protein
MHPYGTDTNERRNLLVILVPLSFWLSAGSLQLLDVLGVSLPDNYDWIFDATSAIGWFGALYLWLENMGWKWWVLQRIGLVRTPNLNGKWSGQLRSSYEDLEKGIVAFEKPIDIDLGIRQSWTRFAVQLRSSTSSSKSDTGSIFVDSGVNPVIVYTYLNRPNPDQVETMEMHSGTTLLELRDDNGIAVLEGNYYNGRGRGNYGTMHLKHCQSLD